MTPQKKNTAERLVAQRRFLDFFDFATPVGDPGAVTTWYDDVKLVALSSDVENSQLFH